MDMQMHEETFIDLVAGFTVKTEDLMQTRITGRIAVIQERLARDEEITIRIESVELLKATDPLQKEVVR
jgi:hypothetical protein